MSNRRVGKGGTGLHRSRPPLTSRREGGTTRDWLFVGLLYSPAGFNSPVAPIHPKTS